jgi:hypothetical protein
MLVSRNQTSDFRQPNIELGERGAIPFKLYKITAAVPYFLRKWTKKVTCSPWNDAKGHIMSNLERKYSEMIDL